METYWIFFAAAVFGLVLYGFQLLAVRSSLSAPRDAGEDNSLSPFSPPISILKPLKGLDDNLLDNLLSFCALDYPEYEIIFTLQNHNDPAYKVARKVRERNPGKDITIIVEETPIGLNPKVNNLVAAYRAARYEYVLISDSNVMVEEDYLKAVVSPLRDPQVGLVSNVIRGAGGRTLGAVFENLHLNSFIMGSVCFLDRFLKMPCVIGKSMLMRKRDLEAIGGLRAVKDILAEDYIIGERMHKSGRRVVLSKHIINNINEYWSVQRFFNRHTRWGKLRWKIGGPKYLVELLGNPVFLSVLPLLWEQSRVTISVALFISLVKILGDFTLARRTGTELASPLLYMLSPVKDILIGLLWFVPLVSTTVVWRGNRYRIGRNSALFPCPETGFWSLRYRIVDVIKGRLA
ncbi:MAG: ceramide glucosyltransferase [Nitrospirota bacterium]